MTTITRMSQLIALSKENVIWLNCLRVVVEHLNNINCQREWSGRLNETGQLTSDLQCYWCFRCARTRHCWSAKDGKLWTFVASLKWGAFFLLSAVVVLISGTLWHILALICEQSVQLSFIESGRRRTWYYLHLERCFFHPHTIFNKKYQQSKFFRGNFLWLIADFQHMISKLGKMHVIIRCQNNHRKYTPTSIFLTLSISMIQELRFPDLEEEILNRRNALLMVFIWPIRRSSRELGHSLAAKYSPSLSLSYSNKI